MILQRYHSLHEKVKVAQLFYLESLTMNCYKGIRIETL